ncbi:MAG: hypothetical protein B7Y39_18935 [Bdellovibrio sp. 28-41-41]|nr:MAG: hypothetical protein B7Y39_18935 [Bdellovibrio sp. 28-41-41]
MSEEKASKPRSKKDERLVENGIYQVGPNLYDVKVRKRIKKTSKGAGVQKTKAKRNVRFLSEARKVRNQFIHELELTEKELLNGDYTWKEAKEVYFDFRKHGVAVKTFYNQVATVNKHTESWDSMRLSEFKQEFIHNDLQGKLVGYPKSSVQSILKHIRAVFDFHFHKQRSPLTHNPCKGIKGWGKVDRDEAKEIPKMSEDEIKKLLHHTKSIDSEFHPLFFCAYHLGARSAELWSLKWDDISPDFKFLTIKRAYCFQSKKEKPPKNGTARRVSINKSLAEFLKSLKIKSDSTYVLNHHPMWRDGKIATVLRVFQKELKISQTSFHSIRASHITHLLLKGVSPVAVMNSVGHSDYKTTDRYVREINKEKSIENMTDVLDDTYEGKVIPMNKKKEEAG